jgi:hypothetical protein
VDSGKIDPGVCGCGTPDTDSDGDGTADCIDNCPADSGKVDPGVCGCGTPDTDSDGDGTADCNDQCSTDPGKTEPGICGCGTPDTDSDGDGYLICDDCNDSNPAINPGASEICGNGIDENCDDHDDVCPLECIDEDGDGYGTGDACLGPDCNDNNPSVHPTATEMCDNLDNNCDGLVDENLTKLTTCGVGKCAGNTGTETCIAGSWGNDTCNPFSGANPEGPIGKMKCRDDIDNDCDGFTDLDDADCNEEPLTETECFDGIDNDQDGVPDCGDSDCEGQMDGSCTTGQPGICSTGIRTCQSEAEVCVADNQPQPEICDGLDNNCDGLVDEGDADNDGTPDCNDGCPNDPGKIDPGICGCGTTDTDSDGDGTPDCNDQCPDDPDKSEPGICGCGVADTDSDGDGTADCNDSCPADSVKTEPGICGCGVADLDTDGDNYPTCLGDCNDNDPLINPGMTEIPYNGIDDDCNSATPDDDLDGDSYPIAEDCDDTNVSIYPGAPELCDVFDNDCNDIINDEVNYSFIDISPEHWAEDYISGIACAEITTGCDALNYCPINNVTRAQMAAFIIRSVEGEPANDYCGNTDPFNDVSSGHWACKYIKRLSELGITGGCGGDNYCPISNVTRAQIMVRIFLLQQYHILQIYQTVIGPLTTFRR